LDPDDAATADDRYPDDPEDYRPDSDLHIYMDTLPGRSSNRYFYRAAYVDGAQNRSHLSLASPPVYLPKVTPPRTPVITKVLGSDRQIILRWNCSREPDLAEYRVYRTDKKENARDIRLMTLIHMRAVPPGDRPRIIEWADEVPGLVLFHYTILALDTSGNASKLSKPVAARAFDESLPIPPVPQAAWSGEPAHIQVTWTSEFETLLQRKTAGTEGTWIQKTHWLLPGEHYVSDPDANVEKSYEYRLYARKSTGAITIGESTLLETLSCLGDPHA